MKIISFLKNEIYPFSDDKILAGRRLPPECNVELHTDYGGQAVKWGLTHHKESAYECCQACLDHARNAKPNEVKCNIWVYCPDEEGCHSPDKYEHKLQECWLKYVSLLFHLFSLCLSYCDLPSNL